MPVLLLWMMYCTLTLPLLSPLLSWQERWVRGIFSPLHTFSFQLSPDPFNSKNKPEDLISDVSHSVTWRHKKEKFMGFLSFIWHRAISKCFKCWLLGSWCESQHLICIFITFQFNKNTYNLLLKLLYKVFTVFLSGFFTAQSQLHCW